MTTASDDVERGIVARWATIYDAVYESEVDAADFVGWRSSITGENYTPGETDEWLRGTVREILDLRPERVWEIGAGTGLIVRDLLPHVRRYLATEISPVAVQRMRRSHAGDPRVDVRVAAATDDIDAGDTDDIDTVVLNSVVHHFPSVGYLVRVLDRAVRAVGRHAGSVFIGDVHSFALRDALRLRILAATDPGELTAGQVLDLLGRQAARERELVVDPAFFSRYAQRHGLVADIRLKPGYRDTEMNLFRYDVRLRPPSPGLVDTARLRRVRYAPRILDTDPARPVLVAGIAHPGLFGVARALDTVRAAEPSAVVNVAALVSLSGPAGPEPARLCAEAAARGLAAFATPSSESGCYDLVLADSSAEGLAVPAGRMPGEALTNVPVQPLVGAVPSTVTLGPGG